MTAPDYLAQPLGDFLDHVAARRPAPGGGCVAAVAVAMAAGLAGMAARFSDGQLPDADALAVRADALRARVAPLVRADADAYGEVLAASEAGREVGPALARAAEVPRAVAEIGTQVAELAARLAREGNVSLRGDARTAVLLAEAGSRAASALAEINEAAAARSSGNG